ncbi:HNH endonuclease signature motif containing protein [Amycolatopsis anabasis]|uniref:HNH endonuclease signature motif containing protein n=1 Tax=Amycolatopsis anabasis TaxID=1840409 RepID=UPI00131C13D8|nr:HNH endonuclease signature motif containing protein [Amycolatopsis anabasis]
MGGVETNTRLADLKDIIQLEGEVIARAQARQLRAIAELDNLQGRSRGVPVEIAWMLNLVEHKAAKKVALARTLTTRLLETLKAMEGGVIDEEKAAKIAEPTAYLSDEKAREVDAIMARRLQGKNPSSLRKMVNYWIAKIDKAGYEARCKARRADRQLQLIHQDHGMSTLVADVPVEKGSAAYHSIDREARKRKTKDESRTLDQLRADVLIERCLGSSGGDPKADIYVYVDLQTLTGLNNDPAQLAGYGPIPATIARDIAHSKNSTWRRIVTDPVAGLPVDVGRTRYRPPTALDRYIRLRDRECRAPGCNRPTQAGDIDHTQDWAKGGTTDKTILGGWCERHHYLKDQPGWNFEPQPNGNITITTPTGGTYTSKPEPLHEPRG